MTTVTRPYNDVDISSKSFWAQPNDLQDATLDALRDASPVSWHPPLEGSMGGAENDPGFWAVTGAAEIREVSLNPGRFSSSAEYGGVLFDNVPIEILEYATSFLVMDPPEHSKLRRLVSAAFTPRRVATIQQQIRNQASEIVDAFVRTEGEIDFVEQVSTRLPMWTMSEMVGVPPELREAMVEAANTSVGFSDPQDGLSPEISMFTAVGELMDLAQQLAEQRRVEPRDDLMTGLVQAEVDGHRLTDDQISSFFVLLCGAGTDTTRNSTSMTMKALYDHWDQWRYIAKDIEGRIEVAVEEFIRWTSPVMTMRRTAAVATTLGGQEIDHGDKVVMFYRAGNRDPRAFTDPNVFDVTRSPNAHVAFGGRGPHNCLGQNLARTQLRALFSELIGRVARMELGEPEYVPNATFIRGVKQMSCRIIERV